MTIETQVGEKLVASEKKLVVDMEGPVPVFEFYGNWTGHDALVIMRHIRTAYHKHQRDMRRQDANPITNPATQEKTDER